LSAWARRGDPWAWALILLGLGVRIWATGEARFTEEESLFWRTARQIAAGVDLPLYGPSLTGSPAHHPGPLFYYLMALPQALGSSPRLGGVFVAVLHAGAGAAVGSAFARVGGRAAGRAGLALWVFAPWDVLYADRIWLSCVAPAWATFLLYAALRASDGPRWQAALLFFAVTAPQLHMSAPIVWASAAAWLALGPGVRWSRPAAAAGLALGLATYAPTYLFELTHGLENTQAILRNSGGKAGLVTVVNSPLRVFGNAVLAGTSEISYHFMRGYWQAFVERDVYLSPTGWQAWLHRHGPLWAPVHLSSLGLAFAAWGAAVGGLGRRAQALASQVAGWRARLAALRGLDPGDRLTLALLAGLGAAVLLLIASRKGYYPHYSNLLVPFALWPVARGLASAWAAGGRWRGAAAAGLAVSAVAMAGATAKYYREVDALNGLTTTEALVARALAEPGPLALRFTGFDNHAAWQNLALGRFGRPLVLDDAASLRWTVHNDQRRGPPEGPGFVVGGVQVTLR
jgi:hypothetical protein